MRRYPYASFPPSRGLFSPPATLCSPHPAWRRLPALPPAGAGLARGGPLVARGPGREPVGRGAPRLGPVLPGDEGRGRRGPAAEGSVTAVPRPRVSRREERRM